MNILSAERVLVLWAESTLGRRQAEESITLLAKTGCHTKICVETQQPVEETSFSFKTHNAEFVQDIETLVAQTDLLFIPMLPISLLNQIVSVNTDELLSAVVLCFLFRNKPVYVLNSAIDGSMSKDSTLPVLLRKGIEERTVLLQSAGMQLVAAEALFPELRTGEPNIRLSKPAQKKMITECDMIAMAEQGTTQMHLYSGDIITSLAVDMAKEKKITIIREQ